MIYLLDVNVLLAMFYGEHVHYVRVRRWITQCRREPRGVDLDLTSCAITELGFIRVAAGKAGLAPSVSAARSDLMRLKARERIRLLPDALEAEHMPAWVRKPAQTTDGHLVMLARMHGASFATLDEGVPDALLIPRLSWEVRDSHGFLPVDGAYTRMSL